MRLVPLRSGDAIITGSPNTFSAVTPGDTVEIRLSGIGSLTNRVV
jgi:2-keto-4-pentenoate hydratase/2-oxohepta-3-ene-1,7-dioic acid hydratase in catechol pathway